jgi:DNA invertase Pin-like site-specific DNA recombinase
LAAQKSAVQTYLNGGKWQLISTFQEVESGKKNNRPKLQAALRACRIHRAKLIVAKVDRLTRNVAFLNTILESSVEVLFCDLPQIEGPAGKFLLQQMAAVAELEAGFIGARTRAALAQTTKPLGGYRLPGLTERPGSRSQRHRTARRRTRQIVRRQQAVRPATPMWWRTSGRRASPHSTASPRSWRAGASSLRVVRRGPNVKMTAMGTNKDYSKYQGLYPQLTIRCGDEMRDRLFEIRVALADAAGEDANTVSMSQVIRDAVDLMHKLICRRETLEPPERPKKDRSREYWRDEPKKATSPRTSGSGNSTLRFA